MRSLVLFISLTLCASLQTLQADSQSDADYVRAEKLANAVPWLSGVVVQSNSTSMHSIRYLPQRITPHPLARQTLSIEENFASKERKEKTLSVLQYDYDEGNARVVIVSLETDTVLQERFIPSVHLPLSDEEIAQALQWLSADGNTMQQLRNDQIRRGREPFISVTELSLKAIVFEPEQTGHPCATERCALLSLFDDSHTVFALEPVVYLERGTVGRLGQ